MTPWDRPSRGRLRVVALAAVLTAFAALLLVPATALAFKEPNLIGGNTECGDACHNPAQWDAMDCESCHGDVDVPPDTSYDEGYEYNNFQGPHGKYTTVTDKCDNCHSVHVADGSQLLPAATIAATCFTCHDGTAGWGVYGTILARLGTQPGGGHSYEETNAIPGGSALTGGETTRTFGGTDGNLVCTDCHTPHGANAVAPFRGDRRRLRWYMDSITSNRLLKQRPTGSTTTATVYGSDWCATCHAGRNSGGTVHNHPVDSLAVTTTPFDYGRVAVLDSDAPTAVTTMAPLGGVWTPIDMHDQPEDTQTTSGNRGYLMPYPRTAQQTGHAPICQQCHEDSRVVGQLTGDGSTGDAEPAAIEKGDAVYWNGSAWATSTADNPMFQDFPHETVNTRMLVETNDDLCLNCHPANVLP